MNAETMPLKHNHHQPPCGVDHPPDNAPSRATTKTTTLTRALVLCGVAAVVGVAYLSGSYYAGRVRLASRCYLYYGRLSVCCSSSSIV